MSDDAWSNLDKVDQKIIEILNNNARTPSKEIASELKKCMKGFVFLDLIKESLDVTIWEREGTPHATIEAIKSDKSSVYTIELSF